MTGKMGALFVIPLAAATLAGCGNQTPDKPAPQSQPAASSNAQGGFPMVIKDSTGTDVKINKKPARIVSIMPNTTEIAYSLGLDREIVGVSNYDDYPPQVKSKPKVGDLNASAEKIVAMQPDLILADTGNGKTIQSLRKLGLPVLVTGAQNIDGIYQSIEEIGQATGTKSKADGLVGRMKKDVQYVTDKTRALPANKKPKVWVEVDPNLYTSGKGTFIDSMINMAGGVNIASDINGWKQMSEEKIIQSNPDIILETYGYYMKGAVDNIKHRPKWQNITAVKKGQVYEVDSNTVTRPGTRITEGLKQIAGDLHPELYKK
ncbi:ABC transporter substrate-binding protein [Aneurinibacillus sp. Ricciae_BoGa-3]|uniref:ABC transporter substrate-binding protein n=1 Tax=Aneurinibacillus sp. Ricciae_BoGa-3 TaxID=3022697 RepID=UPI0023411023|nr:ABC transporter substrate-binding protein [Aneurinibacillus sp. Ricciae_BoGa-3]WCK53954.1 ABC transporter substrate-binding protein [Aneurinibacillus sp. Ricciae_BoGa-3]